MEISKYLNTAKMMAIVSFGLGTCLFLLHWLVPQNDGIIMIGLYYVILAGFSNFIMLLVLLGMACIRTDVIDEIAKSILLLIANIPIAIIYFLLVIQW